MKQLLQNLGDGQTTIMDVPTPSVKKNHVLIQTVKSVVSIGTEKMLVDFGKANFINKAKQQPDKVKEVLDKVKTDGITPTYTAVKSKLDQPIPLGYSNVGIIIAVGDGVENFKKGDRVISNGNHAEIVSVPKQLVCKVPDNVKDEDAAFTVVSSIGLQGIRLAAPSIGETFVVTGLGLIGLLVVQLLKAQSCNVIAVDMDEKKLKLAKSFGAEIVNIKKGEDPVAVASEINNGQGVDGVIITASSKSNEPVHQAAQMCRKKGRIILVGVVGLELIRDDFYEKELTFQVSCSYGPGRYDKEYEEKGRDYPIGYVRWTENRNFEAILNLMAQNKIEISKMITHQFKFNDAINAYETIQNEPSIGVILNYPENKIDIEQSSSMKLSHNHGINNLANTAQIGVIGAGNFTNQVILPALSQTDANLKTIASSKGLTSTHIGKKYGFEEATTMSDRIMTNPDINTVFIMTPHNTHGNLVEEALRNNKHVFVEKPLALTKKEINTISNINTNKNIMVGFNRRFSPHAIKMKELLNTVKGPKTLVMVVNAGHIPADHWTQDHEIGGGRIIGEAVHFLDLFKFLTGSSVVDFSADSLNYTKSNRTIHEDKATITFKMSDGSLATLHYFANGNKSYPKEKLEVFAEGKILSLDNFKHLEGYGWKNFKKMKLLNQDKGHRSEIKEFIKSIENGKDSPIKLEDILETSNIIIDVHEELQK